MTKNPAKNFKTVLGTAVHTLTAYPAVFFPFLILGFIQLLILEFLYFIPRPPLSDVIGPIVRRLWSEAFLHYPLDLVLLPKLYYYAQIVIYLIIGGFLAGVAVKLIASINSDSKITVGKAFKETLPSYVHILLNSILSFAVFLGLSQVYGLAVRRALQIRSEAGVFFWIKKVVILGEPYANFLIGIFVTALLAFVIPIIVIERKKFFAALFLNFKSLWRSFIFVFFIILLPTLLYVPILLLRSNINVLMDATVPDIQLWSIVLSIVVTLVIDAVVITAVTTYYLFKKESIS
jgi:hypothetical protein